MAILQISSIAELDELRAKSHSSAERSKEALGTALDGSTGLSLLELVKFHPIGCDPLDATRPLNLIEQVNQTFTYLVSLVAAGELLRRHSEAAPFILNLGARGGTDVISEDETVGAEVLAAVRPTNNQKLARWKEREGRAVSFHTFSTTHQAIIKQQRLMGYRSFRLS